MLSTAINISYWRLENHELADTGLIDHIAISLCDSCGIPYPHFRLHLLLTEMISNAIDHGVLKMDSRLKQSPAGFERYMSERSRRLAIPVAGWISITAEWLDVNLLRISIRDSGNGFEYNSACTELSAGSKQGCIASDSQSIDRLYGRGLQIINGLCESVVHIGCGNCTVAEFKVAI